jgi:hypothetical protein
MDTSLGRCLMRDLNRYATDYTGDYDFERRQVQFRRRAALRIIEQLAPRTVLEVGCGTEPFFLDCPHVREWHTVEPAVVFADAARLAAAGRPGVVVHQGFLETEAPRLRDVAARVPFDVIFVSGLLQEVPDPLRFLDAVASLCTLQTIVHISVANAQSLHRQFAVAMGLQESTTAFSKRNHTFQQRTVYDRDTLRHELESVGFDIVADGGILLKPFEHARMQAALAADILTDAHLEGLAVLGETMPELASEIWVNVRRRTSSLPQPGFL